MKIKISLCALACALSLAACSSPKEPADSNIASDMVDNGATETATAAGTIPMNAVEPVAPATAANPRVLGLEGLGDLRVGAPIPEGGGWAVRGAQQSDSCRTVTSPDYPGVYGIVEKGAVRRITVGQRSDVKPIEGIGIGSTEKEVAAAFPGFRSEPHKYVEPPAKYLTAPNAASGDVALRFEIGRDGKVSLMHVGTMPVLGYV
jgi:hypothetical protein